MLRFKSSEIKDVTFSNQNLGVGKMMDARVKELEDVLEPNWSHFGSRINPKTSERVNEMMSRENFRHTSDSPMRER